MALISMLLRNRTAYIFLPSRFLWIFSLNLIVSLATVCKTAAFLELVRQIESSLPTKVLAEKRLLSDETGTTRNNHIIDGSSNRQLIFQTIQEIIPLQEPIRRSASRLYQYIMHAQLQLEDVKQVITFLNATFVSNPDTLEYLITQHPRILRRSVESQLQPVVNFLRDLYGEEMFLEALSRNPTLLLVSGVGFFNSRQKENKTPVQHFLKDELQMPLSMINELYKKHPFIFRISVDRGLRPVVSFVASLLAEETQEPIGGQEYWTGEKYSSESQQKAILEAMDPAIRKRIVRLISTYSNILSLTLEGNLYRTVDFLRTSCYMDASNLANMVKNCPSVLGLSVEDNLSLTLDFLVNSVGLEKPQDFRRCIGRHTQILCLSLENLQSKISFFQSLDSTMQGLSTTQLSTNEKCATKALSPSSVSLVYRIAVSAPSVYSLSLRDNIIPKLVTLAKAWDVDKQRCSLLRFVEALQLQATSNDDIYCCNFSDHATASIALARKLKEYPAILTFSHDANIIPTLQFLNRTGFLTLNDNGYVEAVPTKRKGTTYFKQGIPARYLAASLYTRLLPRWHYVQQQSRKVLHSNTTTAMSIGLATEEVSTEPNFLPAPLHILALSSDLKFCKFFNFSETSFLIYKKEAIPKLKFSTQFENWIKTGVPIDSV